MWPARAYGRPTGASAMLLGKRAICPAFVASLFTAALCAAQPGNPVDRLPPGVLLPSGRIEVTGAESVDVLSVSNDGPHAWVVVSYPTINAWPWLVHRWVALATAALVGIVVIVGIRMWRILARPQEIGKPHCRGCGYCLFGVAGRECPECGRGLSGWRATVTGRARLPRVVPAIAVGALAAGLYVFAIFSLPAHGSACTWFDWPSVWLADWEGPQPNRAKSRKEPHPRGRLSRIVELDLHSGAIWRSIYQSTRDFVVDAFQCESDTLFVRTDRSETAPTIRIDLPSGTHSPAAPPSSASLGAIIVPGSEFSGFAGLPDGFQVTGGRRVAHPRGLLFAEAVAGEPHVHLHLVGDAGQQRWIGLLSFPSDVKPCWLSLYAISENGQVVVGGGGKKLWVWQL